MSSVVLSCCHPWKLYKLAPINHSFNRQKDNVISCEKLKMFQQLYFSIVTVRPCCHALRRRWTAEIAKECNNESTVGYNTERFCWYLVGISWKWTPHNSTVYCLSLFVCVYVFCVFMFYGLKPEINAFIHSFIHSQHVTEKMLPSCAMYYVSYTICTDDHELNAEY